MQEVVIRFDIRHLTIPFKLKMSKSKQNKTKISCSSEDRDQTSNKKSFMLLTLVRQGETYRIFNILMGFNMAFIFLLAKRKIILKISEIFPIRIIN